MTDILLLPIGDHGIEPEICGPSPDRILSGEPVHRTWNVEDDGAGTYAGLWESTAGEWRIEYDEWEFCQILSGTGILTSDNGLAYRYGPGDSFVVRRGFRGTWRVEETTRKRYVIRT